LLTSYIVGLAITALQATTIEAQVGDPNMPPPGAPYTPTDIGECEPGKWQKFGFPSRSACEQAVRPATGAPGS